MEQVADLEISLHRREEGKYTVEMRVSQPGSETDIRLGQDRAIYAAFNFKELDDNAENPAAYGMALSKALFADPDLLKEFSNARTSAQTAKVPLRVRLVIGPSAPELNELFWESLRDPADEKATLFTGEQIYLSRYLSSLDWRPVVLRSKGDLKALVAISNPSNLSEYPDLAPVDTAGELKRAQAALKNIPVTALPASPDEHCSLNAIIKCLADGYDILYIVAHGAFLKEEPWLWLEDEEGKVARVSGHDLTVRIRELENRPRLVVLASCQSAGKGSGAALQSLGPSLAQGGIPAVLAMQGSISMPTVEKFMPVFFEKLQEDGQIDRAAAIARGMVRDADDFWMPVLFMRLRSGRIWFVPGFGEEGPAEPKKWKALLSDVGARTTTPILGGGVHEKLYGSNRDLALDLADASNYPLAQSSRDALPQVTQFLSIDQTRNTLLRTLNAQIRKKIQSRFAADLPADLKSDSDGDDNALLLKLISFGGKKLRENDPAEPHRMLARMRLPVYINTNFDNMMYDALVDAGTQPEMVICPWSDRFLAPPSVYDRQNDKGNETKPIYTPDPDHPLVYHIFGHFSVPDSLVLTEDDHFEFLIGATKNRDLIPPTLLARFVNSGLMFLGFQLDDWAFRIFFRYILDLGGSSRRDKYANIAVQVDPDEMRNSDPRRAREYLKEYFDLGSINIYWGQSQDFARALVQQLPQEKKPELKEN